MGQGEQENGYAGERRKLINKAGRLDIIYNLL